MKTSLILTSQSACYQRGLILVFALIMLLVLTVLVVSGIVISRVGAKSTQSMEAASKAFSIASAGVVSGTDALKSGTPCGSISITNNFGDGQYNVTGVADVNNVCTLTSLGAYPSIASPISAKTVIANYKIYSNAFIATADEDSRFYIFKNVWSLNYSDSLRGLKIVYGIDCASKTDCWAVTEGGLFYHYDGNLWSYYSGYQSPGGRHLYSIACPAANDCWASGEDGSIYHYDGSSWTNPYQDPAKRRIYSIVCLSSSFCMAVGEAGTGFYYDGISWNKKSAGTGDALFAVSCISDNDCWAAGQKAKFWHWDGSSWTLVTDLLDNYINAIVCTGAADCWAVGNYNRIYRYTGSSWTTYAFTPPAAFSGKKFLALSCSGPNDCLASGENNYVFRWDSSNWIEFKRLRSGTEGLYAIKLIDAIDSIGEIKRI